MMHLLRTLAEFLLQCSAKSRLETAIWTVKLILLSVGVLSTYLLLKLAIPCSFTLIFSTVPRVWIFFCGFLAPPYLYVLVNFIIITIVASSNYQQHQTKKKNEGKVEGNLKPQPKKRGYEAPSCPQVESEIWYDVPGEKSPESDHSSSVENSSESSPETGFDYSCLTSSDEKLSFDDTTIHSLLVGNSVEGNGDTLDETWTAIMEGRGKPLTRQLKKSDTWNSRPSPEPKPVDVADGRGMRKSETFNEGTPARAFAFTVPGGPGKMREPSMGSDELNRQVENFIFKFRLQSQKSHNNYLATLNRGRNL